VGPAAAPDILLLIEVSRFIRGTFGRSVKADPCTPPPACRNLWIVDLTKGQLESFRSPDPMGTTDVPAGFGGWAGGGRWPFPEVALAVDDILMR